MDCFANEVTVALRPLSLGNKTITKKIPCLYQNMRSFSSHPSTLLQPVAGGAGGVADCLSCGSSWLHWLDPQQWMETVWPQTRVVVLVTMLSLGIILTVILCRVVRQVYHCCVPQLRKKSVKNIDNDGLVLSHIERVVDQVQAATQGD